MTLYLLSGKFARKPQILALRITDFGDPALDSRGTIERRHLDRSLSKSLDGIHRLP
jgi:hypothetical protein